MSCKDPSGNFFFTNTGTNDLFLISFSNFSNWLSLLLTFFSGSDNTFKKIINIKKIFFIKFTVTFKQIMQFVCPSRFKFYKIIQIQSILWQKTNTLTVCAVEQFQLVVCMKKIIWKSPSSWISQTKKSFWCRFCLFLFNFGVYPKDPQIVPYPLATLIWSHALTEF